MEKNEDLKKLVRDKYGKIASQNKTQNETSCCGSTGCCDEVDYTIFSEDYNLQSGYVKEADLGLGCGLPTEFAGINMGDDVLDLGSGAGNDCFVARSATGETGKVVGLDFTKEMIEKAEENKNKLGYKNVEFVMGDIEAMPFSENTFDVIISNCVLNLVPDKKKAFSEIYRVLKGNGHFCVSDVVISGNLPDKIKEDAEMYAGCVAGAIQKKKYLDIIRETGFSEVVISKEKEIDIPNAILLKYLTMEELRGFKKEKVGIYSITVSANKSE